MQKECLVCTKPIKGRIDKKFCSDGCRNMFNNKNITVRNSLVKEVNVILARNRKILEEFISAEITRTSRIRLEQRGFNFYYCTHVNTSESGTNYFFCYEYGYHAIGKDCYALVKQEEFDY